MPLVTNKLSGVGFLYIGLTKMSEYDVVVDEHVFKKHVIEAKGRTGASVPFLSDTSIEQVIKPNLNGKQRKCCQILQSSISPNLLQRLINRGTFI
jgi:hypothetical protein